MLKAFSRSAVMAALALVGTAVLVFTAIHLVPGGYADAMLPPDISPAAKAAFIAEHGLNRPLVAQFLTWFTGMFRGDFGASLASGQPVAGEIAARLPVTIELTILGIVASLAIGVPLGTMAALRSRGRIVPITTRTASSLALALPNFFLAAVGVYLGSIHFLGLSLDPYVPFAADPGGNLAMMWLPSLVLGIFPAGLIARTTRDSVLGVLSEPFITAAVARGETPWQIVRRHVFRNASGPVAVLTGVNIGSLLGGVVFVESIFSLPGLGSYTLQAIETRNYAQVQAVVLLGTAVFIVFSLLADIAYAIIDPRVNLTGGSA